MSAILQCNQKLFKQSVDAKLVQAKDSDEELSDMGGLKTQIEKLKLGPKQSLLDLSEKTQSANQLKKDKRDVSGSRQMQVAAPQ